MVKITRLIIEADDIIAFRVMCSQCKGEVLLSIKVGGQPLPSACAICGTAWMTIREYHQVVRDLLSHLRRLWMASCDPDIKPLFTVRMEVDGEAEEERES